MIVYEWCWSPEYSEYPSPNPNKKYIFYHNFKTVFSSSRAWTTIRMHQTFADIPKNAIGYHLTFQFHPGDDRYFMLGVVDISYKFSLIFHILSKFLFLYFFKPLIKLKQ